MERNMGKKEMFDQSIKDLERSGNNKKQKYSWKPVKLKVNNSLACFWSLTKQVTREFRCLLTMKFFKLLDERMKIVVIVNVCIIAKVKKSETFSEPSQTNKMEVIRWSVLWKQPRCLTGFWIYLQGNYT